MLVCPLPKTPVLNNGVEPSRKRIEPVRLVPVTLAVSVMFWPAMAGLIEDATAVDVALSLTSSLRAAEALGALIVSPL